jgi:hypothetical protein
MLFSGVGVLCFFALAQSAVLMLQFTLTPGVAGGAAIALLLHYRETSKKNFVMTIITMSCLFAFCYSFRASTFYVCALLFCACAVACLLRGHVKRMQILLISLIPLFFVAVLYIINYAAYNTPEYREFFEYNNARAQFMDYSRPRFDDAPEIYEAAGLNRVESELINNWFFMFDKVNTEMFRTLVEGVRNSDYGLTTEGVALRERFISYINHILSSDFNLYSFILMRVAVIIIIMSPLAFEIDKTMNIKERYSAILRRYFNTIIAIGVFSFFILSVIYFTERGRLPTWVYRMLVFTTAPTLLILAIKSILGWKRIMFQVLVSLILVIPCVMIVASVDVPFLEERKARSLETFLVPVEYALQHQDKVFLSSISTSARLTPFVTANVQRPTNMIGMLGSGINSPTFMRMMELNGFYRVSQCILFEENVYFMANSLIDLIKEYYRIEFPEYEFILVDEIELNIRIYKLTKIH